MTTTRVEWLVQEVFDGAQEYVNTVAAVPNEYDARRIYEAVKARWRFEGLSLRLVRREVTETEVEP